MYEFLYIGLGNLDDKSWFGTQRFATALSGRNRVLFVERPFTFFEILRGAKRPERILHPIRRWNKNLFVFSPFFVLPFSAKRAILKRINGYLNLFFLKFLLRRLGMKNPILWLDDPFESFYIGRVGEKLLIYNCLHEYSYQPDQLNPDLGFQGGDEINWYNLNIEKRVLQRADLVFCETPSRVDRKKRYNPHVFHLPHGVEFDLYSRALESDYVPGDIKSIPRPIIGFSGTINHEKIDFELIDLLSSIRPQWSFVFVGRIYRNTVIPSCIQDKKNVYFLGEKKYSEVPHYVKLFDVCTIPYKVTRVTKDIQTVKIYEYLATGRPVVTTYMPQLLHLKGVIEIANDRDEFLEKVESSLKTGDTSTLREKRIAIAKQNSWANRAQKIEEIISSVDSSNRNS